MVTMRDVARAAGVSQAAVSYAFSRPEKLSAAQRERVLQIAEELGYTGPHSVGRTLRTGQVGALGLMVTDSLPYAFDDPATAALLRGSPRSARCPRRRSPCCRVRWSRNA